LQLLLLVSKAGDCRRLAHKPDGAPSAAPLDRANFALVQNFSRVAGADKGVELGDFEWCSGRFTEKMTFDI
jgi:hypothetical protein